MCVRERFILIKDSNYVTEVHKDMTFEWGFLVVGGR